MLNNNYKIDEIEKENPYIVTYYGIIVLIQIIIYLEYILH